MRCNSYANLEKLNMERVSVYVCLFVVANTENTVFFLFLCVSFSLF